MELQKTFIFSAVMHVTFFAALLFSAGLLKGSGDRPDEKVIFVKLAVENSKVDNITLVSKKKAIAPAKVKMKKEKKKNLFKDKPPEIIKQEVALEKVPERSEEKAVDYNDQLQKDNEEANTDEQSEPDDALDSPENHKETVHASLLTSVSERRGPGNGSARSGPSPSMLKLISNAIDREKSYPMLARKRGFEGIVHISFRINSSGEPDEIEIKKSSGHSILDSATVKVVKKAAPYPHTNKRVEVPVAYRLRK